ncbi:Alpha/Beta hydrolase protein, partial [Chytriomyces sp. MP71]
IQTPQLYSGSYTDDVRLIIRHIHERNPASTLIGAGFSLGANILMKYVGEEGERCLLSSAVSVANPFDLHLGLVGLHSTWLGKEVYSKVMTRSLIDIYKRHRNKFEKSPDHPTHSGPIESHKILKARYLPDFDELATRRIFGFRSVSEYYRMGSSAQYLPDVRIPCLLLSDLDDPIAQRSAIPVADVLGNPYLVLATTRCGGHIGWFEGWVVPTRWFPTPVMEFVNAIVDVSLI